MTKTQRDTTSTAEDSFHRYYGSVWGEERWRDSLYPALQAPTRYACFLNRYTSIVEGQQRIQDPRLHTVAVEFPPLTNNSTIIRSEFPANVYVRQEVEKVNQDDDQPKSAFGPEFPPPSTSTNGLQTHWNLDAASLLAVHLLDVQAGEHVLDLCAAPGGKSLALAQTLFPQFHADDSDARREALQKKPQRDGRLRSNEFDATRHRRLAENLKTYLPKPLLDAQQVVALRVDGAKPGVEAELRVRVPTPAGGTVTVGYDKVLVDAPCSSERHIIHAHAKAGGGGGGGARRGTADEVVNWRPGSSKRLAKTQVELLMTGLRVAKTGGKVMYATCSIAPVENDGVVEKVLALVEKERKKGAKWKVELGLRRDDEQSETEKGLETWAERTKYGWIVLPDHPGGGKWGPLFFALLTKSEG